ncbi:DUF4129 domain-containing protein [Halorubellus litoreus]|uniref:DUF4129 domain-containing protein n=1 Tax=Halorubellus litoreus TaxID=755308 RepID=A0ABD5VIZ7_9EURY
MLRTRTVLGAVLLVVAFGLAAGSLPSSGGAPAPTSGDGSGDTSAAGGAVRDAGVEESVENPVSSATRDRLLAAVVALAFAVGYALAPRHRRTIAVAAGVVAVAAASDAWLRPAAVSGLLSVVGDATATAVGGPLGVALAVVLALAVTAGVWLAFGRDDGERRPADATDDDAGRGGEPGARPRDVDVHPASRDASDEVTRAWQRVVASVTTPAPGARTPREFVRAASDDGVDASAFARLTELFERVRYGDADSDREAERARSLAARAVEDAGVADDASNGDGRERGGGDA